MKLALSSQSRYRSATAESRLSTLGANVDVVSCVPPFRTTWHPPLLKSNGPGEFFLAGSPLLQVTLAEHQARPGDVILSNQSWKMVMENCKGSVLPSGDVKLLSITNPIPVRQGGW